jgi:rhodanese-related sulfurtransferase
MTLFTVSAGAITPKEAFQLSKSGKGILVDVREENEVKEGMIEGAVWFPMSKISSDKNWKNEFQKLTGGKQVFLYCRSGNRSGKVKDLLKTEGITSENIGGIMTLKDELPVKK